jgi:hypothetical protein
MAVGEELFWGEAERFHVLSRKAWRERVVMGIRHPDVDVGIDEIRMRVRGCGVGRRCECCEDRRTKEGATGDSGGGVHGGLKKACHPELAEGSPISCLASFMLFADGG